MNTATLPSGVTVTAGLDGIRIWLKDELLGEFPSTLQAMTALKKAREAEARLAEIFNRKGAV